jgi:hypothetical protein
MLFCTRFPNGVEFRDSLCSGTLAAWPVCDAALFVGELLLFEAAVAAGQRFGAEKLSIVE